MRVCNIKNSIFYTLLLALLFSAPVLSASAFSDNGPNSMPAVLKADEVEGDKINNQLIAVGNVELRKENSVIYTKKAIYDKNTKIVSFYGGIKANDLEVGTMNADEGFVKDDFSKGEFFDTKIYFNDGSYLKSPDVKRQSPIKTKLKTPIYSICPNPKIAADNSLAGKSRDFISIKSNNTVIDREDEMIRSKHAFFRVYDVPVLYTPYISFPMQSKKKKSGFLTPGYYNNTNLGFGLRTPYYFYIDDNIDVTTTPLISIDSNQLIVNNELRHITNYGQYNLNVEVANNKLGDNNSDTNVIDRTDKQVRWHVKGEGKFDFDLDNGLNFDIDNVSDRNYLRDYHFNFLNYTVSEVNFDHIKARDYYSAKVISIQELDNFSTKGEEPFILPINSHIEFNKPLFYREKYILSSNFTNISRQDGIQYRRLSVTPEVDVPYNVKGNLFNLNAKIQSDLYSIDNNFHSSSANNEYDKSEANYRPEASLNWRLPLIRKSKTNTFVIEPMANIITSSSHRNSLIIPNEDSNNTELTVSNLFISDRISGYDRNETGTRFNYGVKTSYFNKYGEFGLNVGQGYKKGGEQDIEIRGFNDNNKSNIVGQALYKAEKYFSLTYAFQLDESNYGNDVNQINSTLSFERVSFGLGYLLIRKNTQNSREREQLNLNSKIKLTRNFSLGLSNTRDMVTDRDIHRKIEFSNNGCCTIFSFSVSEFNPSSLTKPQKSYNINLVLKNL